MTRHCACGRLVTAGYTAGNPHARCLICATARLMRTFRDPLTERARRRATLARRARKEGGG